MGDIHVLEPHIANLIAAGEVVERPASAVKELLENAIDAGATRITCEIKNGGVSLIRVADNGRGMSRDDAETCLLRHATSKIRQESDLDGIVTLGFRGEALAAIAGVSHLRILTRTASDDIGTAVDCEAGVIRSVERIGCPVGTTMIVEELFANVPARRKFLRRDATEAAAVSAVAEKIALSRPDISIRLLVDGKMKFETAGDRKLLNVIHAVLGRDFAKNAVAVHDMTDGIEITGYIGSPSFHRGNRNGENFFINGRYIRCQTASAALEQAFSSYIPSERFPCSVLAMTIHPGFVDVNVHPQKMEVKFSEERPVFNAVYCAVRNTLMYALNRPTIGVNGEVLDDHMTGDSFRLYQEILTMKTDSAEEAREIAAGKDRATAHFEQITIGRPTPHALRPVPGDDGMTAEIDTKKPDLPDAEKTAGNDTQKPNLPDAEKSAQPVTSEESLPSCGSAVRPDVSVEGEWLSEALQKRGVSASSLPGHAAPVSVEINGVPLTKPRDMTQNEEIRGADAFFLPESLNFRQTAETDRQDIPCPWFRVTGVAFNCYIFVELEDAMLVIDKHAAHERILFERLRDSLTGLRAVSQMLMVGLPVDLNREETAAALAYREEIEKIGFQFTENGEEGIAVTGIPSGLTEEQALILFSSLCAGLSNDTLSVEIGRNLFYEKMLYQASCKAAVKGGREDSPETIRFIAEQVLTKKRIRYCPHGRPVAFSLTKEQFAKRFERL